MALPAGTWQQLQAQQAWNAQQGQGPAPADFSAEGGGGAGYGDAVAGFSTGSQIGGSIASFIGAQNAARVENAREKRAYNTTLGVFQDLLGQGFGVGGRQELFGQDTFLEGGSRELGTRAESAAAKLEIGENGALGRGAVSRGGAADDEFAKLMRLSEQQIFSDQLVNQGDYENNFLAEGTVIARKDGDKGLDPRLVQARSMLFSLINRGGAIRPDDEANLQLQGANQVGAELQAPAATASNMQGQFDQLQSLGSAGTNNAQTGIQTALTNRAFSAQARDQTLQFIQGLYGTVGSTF